MRQLRTVLRAIGRAIGDASLMAGMGRGAAHGGSRHLHSDHLLNRAVLFGESSRDYESRAQRAGLLDRVPGWLFLVILGLIVIGALFFIPWQR